MSAGHDDGSSLISIGLGALVPAAIATVAGSFAALLFWPLPDPNAAGLGVAFGKLVAGAAVGGLMGLLVAWFMAWHASAIGGSAERSSLAVAWGVVPGILFGMTLGPIFAGVVGFFAGHLVSAILFGLYFGPVVGVLAWEIGFFLGDMFRRRHAATPHGGKN